MFQQLDPRRLIVVLLGMIAGCVSSAPTSGSTVSPQAPLEVETSAASEVSSYTIELEDFRAGLRTISLDVGGERRTFLFDTGAGITAITPDLAASLECEPYGRLTAHRMSGERVDMPLCEGVLLSHDDLELAPEIVGVFDLATLLPPDWPQLDGVVALDSFIGRAVSIDLACGTVRVDEAGRPFPGAEARVRASRPAQGLALDIHVAVPTERGPLWFILDSGNTGPVIVAEHNATLLGLTDSPSTIPLDVPGLGSEEPREVLLRDIIRDGNLGAPFMSRWSLHLDLESMRMWAEPTSCSGER